MGLAERADALDAIYAEIPHIECEGLCQESCGPFPPYPAEEARLLYSKGKTPSPDRSTCPLLLKGRCTAYEIRPILCRLWGVVEGMPCLWGCVPERMLTDQEGHALMSRVDALMPFTMKA